MLNILIGAVLNDKSLTRISINSVWFLTKPPNIFSLIRINWITFRSCISENSLFSENNFVNVNSILDKFYSVIKSAAVQAGGKVRNVSLAHKGTKAKKKPPDAPW